MTPFLLTLTAAVLALIPALLFLANLRLYRSPSSSPANPRPAV